ncbi:MAG: intermembrane phospholipid transport protein YdbH family protein [Kiloniellales bacterium]
MTSSPPESARSAGKQRHRGCRIALVVLGAVVVLGALAYWKRIEIASAIAGYLLAGRQLPPIAFHIEELEPDHARLTAVTVGDNDELRIANVTIAYDGWRALLGGHVERVDLRSLELDADLTGDRPLLGSLTDYIPAGGDRTGPLQLPEFPVVVTLESSILRAATPAGPLTVEIAGASYDPAAADKVSASLTAQLGDGLASGGFEVNVAQDPDLAVIVRGYDVAFRFEKLSEKGLIFDASFTFFEDGRPDLNLISQRGTSVLAYSGVELGYGALGVKGHRDHFEVIVGIASDLKDQSFGVRLEIDGRSSARPQVDMDAEFRLLPSGSLWSLLSLPVTLGGELKVGVSAQAELSTSFPASFSADALDKIRAQIEFELPSIARGEHELNDLVVSLPISVSTTEHNLTGQLTGPADISFSRARASNLIRVPAKVSLQLPEGQVTASSNEGSLTSVEGTVRFDQITKSVSLQTPAGLVNLSGLAGVLEGAWKPGAAPTAKIALEKGAIALPSYRLAGNGLKATAKLGGELPRALDWSLARLEDQAEPARFPPLWLSGKADQRGEDILFTANAGGAKDQLRLSAKGRHRLATGKGEAEIALSPLEFSEGGLQPGDLSPLLTNLTETSGKIEGTAKIAWPSAERLGSARFSIDNLDAMVAGVSFSDLDLALAFDTLHPLSSLPGQTLTVARLDPGLPITDLAIDFQVLPDTQPKLAIERGSWEAIGGAFHLRPSIVDPLAGDSPVTVVVDRLPLDRLFELTSVEGLSGTGTLEGVLPFAYRDGALVLAKGRLAAQAPGVLHFRSEAAKQYLAGSGETVDMALRALEDFRYKELSATLDQNPDGTTLVALSLLGHNPTVLEGHPFRFNINLETRAGELLAVLADSLRLSQGLVRQLWMK